MTACFHCGLPVPAPGRHRAPILGAERELCCAGCEAVARTIAAGGLDSYYRTRTAPSVPADERLPESPVIQERNTGEASLVLDRVTCSACLWLIEQVLRKRDGMRRAEINFATRRAHVSWDPRRTSLTAIIAAVRAVGYDAYPYDPARAAAMALRERRASLWRVFVAGFGAMQVMMYAFPAYIDGELLSVETAQLMRWA